MLKTFFDQQCMPTSGDDSDVNRVPPAQANKWQTLREAHSM